MKNQNRKEIRWSHVIIVILGFVIIILVNGYVSYNRWLTSFGHNWYWESLFLFVLLWAGMLILIPVSLIGLSFQRIRHLASKAFILSIICTIISLVFWMIRGQILEQGYAYLLKNNEVVLEAIIKYEITNGHPPESLQDITPVYLDHIPRKLGEAKVYYTYRTGQNIPSEFTDNNWMLQIEIPVVWIDSAWFIYLPNQNYSDNINRLANWGYLGAN